MSKFFSILLFFLSPFIIIFFLLLIDIIVEECSIIRIVLYGWHTYVPFNPKSIWIPNQTKIYFKYKDEGYFKGYVEHKQFIDIITGETNLYYYKFYRKFFGTDLEINPDDIEKICIKK